MIGFVQTQGSGNTFLRDLNNVSNSFEDPLLCDKRPNGMEFNWAPAKRNVFID